MSQPSPRTRPAEPAARGLSALRTVVAGLLVALGIVWMVLYLVVAQDGQSLGWMGDLERWNFLVGFLLIFAGLAVAAHPDTPLGRGRGVVVGMLGCFLLGLVWIVVYYVAGAEIAIPLLVDLGQYNLIVGIGFMAVGFVYATKWE